MLDAGSQLIVPNPAGDAQVFLTDPDMLAPNGGGTLTVGVTAQEPGAAANGSFGEAELVTAIDGVDLITVTTAQGGQDPEDDDAYLDRVTILLQFLAPRPILPDDHALLAIQIPGVGRASAIDLYIPASSENPVGDTDMPEYTGVAQVGVPRATTVVICGEGGIAPDIGLMQQVFELLDSQREVNFVNYVIAPTYTTIDVQATVVRFPGNSPPTSKPTPRPPSASGWTPRRGGRSRAPGCNAAGRSTTTSASTKPCRSLPTPKACSTSRPSCSASPAARTPPLTSPSPAPRPLPVCGLVEITAIPAP